jgi:hypothetical protein
MDSFGTGRRQVVPKVTAAVLFLGCMTVGTACFLGVSAGGPLFDPDLHGGYLAEYIARASTLLFLFASVLVFLKPRFGYSLGLLAGLTTLPWFIWSELALKPWNSWVLLIQDLDGGGFAAFLKLRILAITLVAMSVGFALTRLIPTRLVMRQIPLCRRNWPALAVGLAVPAVWYVHSITPYVPPMCLRSVRPEFQILHLEKRGLRIYQTSVGATKDGKAYIYWDERSLPGYRFSRRSAVIAMGADRISAFAQSPELWKLNTPASQSLRSWNTECWYVALKDSRLLTFTSDRGTLLPEQITNLLREIEQLPKYEEQSFVARDVCLGFCYDPLAELGYYPASQRRARLLGTQSR